MKAGTKPSVKTTVKAHRHEGTQATPKAKPGRVNVLRAMYGGVLTVFRDGDLFTSEIKSGHGSGESYEAIETSAREVHELVKAKLIMRADDAVKRFERENGLEAYVLTAAGVKEVRSTC